MFARLFHCRSHPEDSTYMSCLVGFSNNFIRGKKLELGKLSGLLLQRMSRCLQLLDKTAAEVWIGGILQTILVLITPKKWQLP